MDLTVLHLAVPAISRDLRPSSTQLLWIIDIYGFTVAGFLVTMGAIGDRVGRRRLLLVGAGAFGLLSILSAISTSPEMLIVGRALLGIAGATIAPSTLSLIFNMFQDPGERARAIAIWISAFSAGSAIGPGGRREQPPNRDHSLGRDRSWPRARSHTDDRLDRGVGAAGKSRGGVGDLGDRS
jgi:MFS transporter, DHA2 family, multidrug resistance protein